MQHTAVTECNADTALQSAPRRRQRAAVLLSGNRSIRIRFCTARAVCPAAARATVRLDLVHAPFLWSIFSMPQYKGESSSFCSDRPGHSAHSVGYRAACDTMPETFGNSVCCSSAACCCHSVVSAATPVSRPPRSHRRPIAWRECSAAASTTRGTASPCNVTIPLQRWCSSSTRGTLAVLVAL